MSVKYSYEFFPPKNTESAESFYKNAQLLAASNPDYFSVTFGAGGSTQKHTPATVEALIQKTQISTAPHISCIDTTRHHLLEMLKHYQSLGINKLVALRGDLPDNHQGTAGDFHHASELVQFIRDNTGNHFTINVAVYPEYHPETRNPQKGMMYFKEKVSAGANAAITQYFYNTDAYERLLENCARLKINIPIIPGIMPLTNYTQITRFSKMCGAEIPRWIRLQLESYADDLASICAFGEEVVTRLCQRLIKLGAPAFHFYTLNKATPSIKILNNLNLLKKVTS